MVVYNPAAEYRLIDMCSSMNMNRIDIIVYWKDTFGNIDPFELHPECSANGELLFQRKDFIYRQLDLFMFLCGVYIYIQCRKLSRIF